VAESRAVEYGASVYPIRADVSDHEALSEALSLALEKLGGVDIAVLNAGVGAWATFTELDRAEFDRVMEVTFTATVNAVRLLLAPLEDSGGALVITGSVADRIPVPMMAPYCAAKHALRGFVGALRSELWIQGSPTKVSLLAPGPVDTPFWRHAATAAGRPEAAVPPFLPYDAETVATEILRVAERPRRELMVGGAVRLGRILHALGGVVSERILARTVERIAGGRDDSGPGYGGLYEASGEGLTGGGRYGRPGLSALGARLIRHLAGRRYREA
jgi:short-subunit dehydrogenase